MLQMMATPTFWSQRQDAMMQYYGTASRNWATAQLAVMLLDPLLQNAQNYLLLNFLMSQDCCASKPLYRAVFTFVLLYIAGCLVSAVIGAFSFINCLNPDEWGRTRRTAILGILLVHLLNLPLTVFAYLPQVHKHFRVQNLWQSIRQAAPTRNIPQSILIFTMAGILCCNLQPKSSWRI